MGWATAIGALLSVAGTGAGIAAADESRSAANKAVDAELLRQNDYRKQGEKVFQQSLQQEAPKAATAAMDKATATTAADYKALQDLAPTTAATITPTSSVVDTVRKAAVAQSNAARSKLSGGWGGFDLNNWLAQRSAADKLNVIGGNANASGSVLPMELQAAGQSGAGLGAVGSLLSSLGSVAGMYGATASPTAVTPGSTAGGFASNVPGTANNFTSLGYTQPWLAYPNVFKALTKQ